MALPVSVRAPVSSRIRSPVSVVRVAVDEVVAGRGLGVVHAWFSFRCLVHEVECLDAEAGGEVEDDAAAFAAGGPSPGFDASDGLRGLSGPDGEFGLAEPLARPVPGEAGAGPSGGRVVRRMVRFGPAGELFHAGVERDGDAGEDPGRHVRGVSFPAIVLAQAAVWHVRVFGELWAAPSPFRAHPPDHGGPVLSLLGRLARETGGVDAEGLRPLADLVGFERGQRGFAFLDPFDGRHIDAGEPCEGLFEDAFPFPDRA